MGVDIRLPIGGMFSIFGLMLLVYGIFTQGNAMYDRSLGININIWWGLVMIIFGGLMLLFALRGKPQDKPVGSGPAVPLPRPGQH